MTFIIDMGMGQNLILSAILSLSLTCLTYVQWWEEVVGGGKERYAPVEKRGLQDFFKVHTVFYENIRWF